MEITLRERAMVDQFKCVDHYRKIKIGELAFKRGELFYFKNGAFDYTAGTTYTPHCLVDVEDVENYIGFDEE